MSAEGDHTQSCETIHGPSAHRGRHKRRFWDLLYLISVTEFKKTYFGTVLGYVWSLLRPLLLFAVLLFVFTQIFRIGSSVPHYPVLLLFNIVALRASSRKQRRWLWRSRSLRRREWCGRPSSPAS